MHKFPFDSADSTNLATNHNERREKYNEALPAFRERVETKGKVGTGYGDPRIGTPRETFEMEAALDLEIAAYKLELEIENMTDKGKPEKGKVYALTGGLGTPCIAKGSTWAESEVKKSESEDKEEDLLEIPEFLKRMEA